MGKRFAAVNLDLLPDVPIPTEMVPVEKADGTKRLVDGASFESSFLLQMDEKVEDLGRSDPRSGLVRVEGIELPNPPEIILFCLP